MKMLSSVWLTLTFRRSHGYLHCDQSHWGRCGEIHIRVGLRRMVWVKVTVRVIVPD